MTVTGSGTQYAEVNATRLAYEEFGQGEPLILLHGGYGTYDMFGANRDPLGAGHRVIGVDLQSHGRTPAVDRPMRFETMADDVAALIRELDLDKASLMGFSLGGGVALRTAIQHPQVVERVVLVSTPFARRGWYPEMRAAMDTIGPETADFMKQTPLYTDYARVAPRPADWPILVAQVVDLLNHDYDWSAEVAAISVPVMLVVGDADGLPPSHAVEFFELLGGGKHDASWDRSGMTEHRLAVLPGVTHYDMHVAPALAAAAIPFLDGTG